MCMALKRCRFEREYATRQSKRRTDVTCVGILEHVGQGYRANQVVRLDALRACVWVGFVSRYGMPIKYTL